MDVLVVTIGVLEWWSSDEASPRESINGKASDEASPRMSHKGA